MNLSKSNVSDNGISHLCGVSTDGSITATGCSRLESLFARNTEVTHFGICLAITILKHLKFVDHKSLQAANEELGTRVLPPKLILKSFSFGDYEFLKLQFKVIQSNEILSDQHRFISYSGYVKSISLASMEDNGTDLESQPSHSYLLGPSRELSYVNGVAPFLADYGQELQAIQLLHVRKVDIFSVLTLCPRLQSMVLRSENYFKSVPRPTIAPQHLERLMFSGGNNLNNDELLHLLLSPNLKAIEISLCASLCDDVLMKAFRHHGFRKLEELTFNFCCNVSLPLFSSIFLSESNALRSIELCYCPPLSTSQNRNDWLSLAASRNWHLNIVVYQ